MWNERAVVRGTGAALAGLTLAVIGWRIVRVAFDEQPAGCGPRPEQVAVSGPLELSRRIAVECMLRSHLVDMALTTPGATDNDKVAAIEALLRTPGNKGCRDAAASLSGRLARTYHRASVNDPRLRIYAER